MNGETTEAPSPSPAPSKPIIIAEPTDSRCWLIENKRLKDEVNSLKQEIKVLKSISGLDS